MAPKKEKTKASNKTAAGAAASSSAGNPSAAGIVPLAVPQRVHNSLDAHLVKVHNALNTINNHPLFADISAKSPLSIQDGGGEHPYFFAESRVVLTQKSSYCAAGNFMWLAHTWMCNHRVPVNPGQIKHLMKNKFPYNAPPERSPYRVQVALDWCDHDACTSAGSLQRFSPEEIDHACLFSIAEAIEKKVPDAVLRAWIQLILSYPMEFHVVAAGDARMWKGQNLREAMVDVGDTVKRSVSQRVHDVAGFKTEKETESNQAVSAAKTASIYTKMMVMARSSEQISCSFVEGAVSIHKRMLSVPRNQEILDWCDEHFLDSDKPHPFLSLYCLSAVCDRAQSPPKTTFALELLVDHYKMDFIDQGHFAVKKIKDVKESYVNVTNFKYDARDYLTGAWLDALDVDPAVKSKVRELLKSVAKVRACVTPYNDVPADTTWQASWKSSGKLTFQLIEDLIYTNIFDGRYRDARRSSLEIVDFMATYPMVTDRVKEITDAIAAEKAESAGTQPPPPVNTGGDASGAGGSQPPTTTPTNATAAPAGSHPTVLTPPTTGFDSLSELDQGTWLKTMNKAIHSTLKFVVDDGTTQDLIMAIHASPLAMSSGDPLGLVLYHFDVKKAGESTTRPDLRIPPVRDTYNRLVKTILEARASIPGGSDSQEKDEPSLLANELSVVLDGGKSGNKVKLSAPWLPKKAKKDDDEDHDDAADDAGDAGGDNPVACVPSALQIVKNEESIKAWRRKNRPGTLAIKQLETAHLISKGRICLPERPREYYPGTNSGDTLTDVKIPHPDTVWRETWKNKKMLYGKKHLILVGGRTEGVEPNDSGQIAKRNDDTVEPVVWHPMPLEFYLQMIDDFYVLSGVEPPWKSHTHTKNACKQTQIYLNAGNQHGSVKQSNNKFKRPCFYGYVATIRRSRKLNFALFHAIVLIA